MRELRESENSSLHEKWAEQYGKTFTHKAILGINRLYTTDLKALNHILNHTEVYQKPEAARYTLGRIMGNGLVVVEGEQHKSQRRIMNPAFGTSQIRELTETFLNKAIELRDVWLQQVAQEDGIAKVEALSWLSRLTLDVIGLAGLNYHFDALSTDPEKNELNQAFSKVFQTTMKMSFTLVLLSLFPAFRWIPHKRDREMKNARDTMDRIAAQLVSDSKAEISESTLGKSLLALLLRANMSTDLPEHQQMSEKDVLAQVSTFLVAGHETTSTAATWAFYSLCRHPQIQQRLRDELLTVPTDHPTMDELNALPYLDAVVRETLRVHPPVIATLRTALKDDALPLNQPFTDRYGKAHNAVHIKKGQFVLIPIAAINRDKSLWGEDAHEFRPERWHKLPDAVSAIPNVWGNTLTFLSGPRACIGFRFSVVETKAILFTLLRAFEFELAVPWEDIGSKSTIVQRPVVKSDLDGGNQLPLLVKPVQLSA